MNLSILFAFVHLLDTDMHILPPRVITVNFTKGVTYVMLCNFNIRDDQNCKIFLPVIGVVYRIVHLGPVV